jgi:hypothetical protein
MTFLFHSCEKRPQLGRWSLGLILVLGLGLSGCKAWRDHGEGLRRNDLAEPARQFRSKTDADKGGKKKAADDPWMSDEANKIARDLE